MINELDEIIDQLYVKIHQFLATKVGEDLSDDMIDINLELSDNEELIINIELYLELSPFSNFDVQKIAEEAVEHGIKAADQMCPPFVVRIKSQNKK